jgi:hypothetical protein
MASESSESLSHGIRVRPPRAASESVLPKVRFRCCATGPAPRTGAAAPRLLDSESRTPSHGLRVTDSKSRTPSHGLRVTAAAPCDCESGSAAACWPAGRLGRYLPFLVSLHCPCHCPGRSLWRTVRCSHSPGQWADWHGPTRMSPALEGT